jgi:UDP-glucose:glycoprotein glucosyltransferase
MTIMHSDCLIPHAVDFTALEDTQVVHAVDERADLDRIVALLERYPLNTTLDLGEPLSSVEIASKYLTFLCYAATGDVDFMQEIGILATQLVCESETPLRTLKQLVQDFPRYATSLSRRVVPHSGLEEEIASNSHKVQPGANAVWLNGAPVSAEDMNPYR